MLYTTSALSIPLPSMTSLSMVFYSCLSVTAPPVQRIVRAHILTSMPKHPLHINITGIMWGKMSIISLTKGINTLALGSTSSLAASLSIVRALGSLIQVIPGDNTMSIIKTLLSTGICASFLAWRRLALNCGWMI